MKMNSNEREPKKKKGGVWDRVKDVVKDLVFGADDSAIESPIDTKREQEKRIYDEIDESKYEPEEDEDGFPSPRKRGLEKIKISFKRTKSSMKS